MLLDELDTLESSLNCERVAIEGTLRVTAAPGFASRYLEVLTSDFFTQHPAVCIDLTLTHRLVDLVSEGIDVAIRVTEPRDSSLIVRKLAAVAIIAVAAPSYLKRTSRPKQPSDLKKHQCLVDSNFREQQRWKFAERQRVTVSGPVRVNSPIAIRRLALAGHGIALVPRFLVADDLRERRLVEVLRGKVKYTWAVYAAYARREFLPRRIRAYVDHLAAAALRG